MHKNIFRNFKTAKFLFDFKLGFLFLFLIIVFFYKYCAQILVSNFDRIRKSSLYLRVSVINELSFVWVLNIVNGMIVKMDAGIIVVNLLGHKVLKISLFIFKEAVISFKTDTRSTENNEYIYIANINSFFGINRERFLIATQK